jgi:hypothetical protein
MRARLPSPAAALAALLVLAAGLTGCGSSGSSSKGNGIESKTPTEIVAAAKVLADSANSVHVAGSIQSGGSPITLDLHLLASKGGRGQLSENGLSFELIQIHGTVFIKGSPAFYRHVAGPTAAQLLQGRWLKAPASTGNLASLASLTDLHQLMDTTLVQHGTLAKGATTTIAGQKVLAITDTSNRGTLYVATTGPPYPVAVTKAGTSSGRVLFSNWNAPVSVLAPANAIDITQLAGR